MVVVVDKLLDLSGKTAVVTGGAMGIGLGIVNRLHEAGTNVVIADLDDAAAKKAAEELNAKRGNSALAVKTDVSDKEAAINLMQTAVNTFGGLDILVNNAGIYPPEPLSVMSEEDFMRVIDVNLRGAFLCTRYASQHMISQGRGGRIINITSIDAIHPSMVGLSHYDASKHGLWGFTKNAALELSKYKIWVNALAPGGITTPGTQKMQGPATKGVDTQAMIAEFLKKIPMGRMGDSDEIGKVVLFLASDMSSYMTGSQVVVDGGALLG